MDQLVGVYSYSSILFRFDALVVRRMYVFCIHSLYSTVRVLEARRRGSRSLPKLTTRTIVYNYVAFR